MICVSITCSALCLGVCPPPRYHLQHIPSPCCYELTHSNIAWLQEQADRFCHHDRAGKFRHDCGTGTQLRLAAMLSLCKSEHIIICSETAGGACSETAGGGLVRDSRGGLFCSEEKTSTPTATYLSLIFIINNYRGPEYNIHPHTHMPKCTQEVSYYSYCAFQ